MIVGKFLEGDFSSNWKKGKLEGDRGTVMIFPDGGTISNKCCFPGGNSSATRRCIAP